MSDLVNRSEVKNIAKGFTFTFAEERQRYMDFLDYCLENAPIVDAVPVVHAEWIDTQPDYHSGFYGNAHKCSNCNDYYTTEYDDLFFCPRCGAKMDGKKAQE